MFFYSDEEHSLSVTLLHYCALQEHCIHRLLKACGSYLIWSCDPLLQPHNRYTCILDGGWCKK